MTISLEDGKLKVNIFNYYASATSNATLECYAELSEDGTELTILSKGLTYNYEAFTSDVVLKVGNEGKELSASSISWGYQSIANYTATKQ